MYEIYVVKGLDTLESIANSFNTTESELRNINGFFDRDELVSGISIIVPTRRSSPYTYYTVKKGDNVSKIASMVGVNPKLLLAINGLEENDYIYPNQTIMIPNDNYTFYLTETDDTLADVSRKSGVSIDKIIDNNEKIYLIR